VRMLDALEITLADKCVVDTSQILPRVKLRVGSVHTWTSLYVLDDLDDDIILGMDWLECENHRADWRGKTLSFRGLTVPCVGHLGGSQPPHRGETPDYLISRKQLKRLAAHGTDVFVVMLKHVGNTKGPVDLAGVPSSVLPDIVRPIVEQYASVFSKPTGPPPDRPVKHSIPLIPDFKPPARAPYRMSADQLQELKSQLTELIDLGFIRPSTSHFASPVLLVPKPNGKWRFCIDYRALNLGTIKDRYPLPRMDDLFQQVQGAQFFSKLDFVSGYHQLEMVPEDIHKTAFITRYGLFEWVVMPMGLSSAPSTFQRAMNSLFHDLLDSGVVVYLDDVLIYARTREEHDRLLRIVLQRLHDHSYYASLDTCQFAQERIQFLGHIRSAQGIQPVSDKVQAVRDWPRPTSVHDGRCFLGLCSFY